MPAPEQNRPAADDPASLYTGEAGRAYHEQRAQSRSQIDQSQRAIDFMGLSTDQDVVLDFGCGTGGVLRTLPARRRIGVEINERAAADARTRLDAVHSALDQVPPGSVDVAISFHALEHVADPLTQIKALRRVLKPDGRLRIIVPSETPVLHPRHRRWKADDVDMHLYSWTPLTLGNLLTVAGLRVTDSRVLPRSGGGRLAAALAKRPRLAMAARWLKALRGGLRGTQLAVTAVKDA